MTYAAGFTKDWRWTMGLACSAMLVGALLYLIGAFVPCTDYRALRKGPLQVTHRAAEHSAASDVIHVRTGMPCSAQSTALLRQGLLQVSHSADTHWEAAHLLQLSPTA